MYCVVNKQSVTNFRSTNSARYELACASVAQYNTLSQNLLNFSEYCAIIRQPNYCTGQFSNCLRVITIGQEWQYTVCYSCVL